MANVIEFKIRGVDEFSRTFDGVQGSLKKTAQNLKQVGDQSIALGKTLSARVTAPIVAMGAGIVKVAGDFEQSMNKVGALSGATEAQFQQLRDQAAELGETTQFSASQAADAMGFLSMAGFDANETLGAMPGTLELAASAQMDLGRTADIVSNILTGYQKDVSELGHVNDVLVKGFTSANVNLEQLGEAMKFVAPVASSAGVAFEEATAAVAMMGDAGIQGSMAGTALRGAITRLLNPTSKAAGLMEEMGVKAVDAEGRLLPLDDIIAQLEPHADDTGAMMEIFGQRAGPAMAALVSQGAGSLRELTDELENSGGTASRIAAVQMEGFNGAMRELRSAFEGLAISIADSGLLDFATSAAQKIAELVRWISDLPEPVLAFGTVVAGVLAAGGPVLIGFGLVAKAIGAVIAAAAPLAGLVAAAGPIGLFIAAAALLTAAWVAWGDEIKVAIGTVIDWIVERFTMLRDTVLGLWEEMTGGVTNLWGSTRDKVTEVTNNLTERVGEGTTAVTQRVAQGWTWLSDTLVGNSIIPDMVERIQLVMDESGKRLVQKNTQTGLWISEGWKATANQTTAVVGQMAENALSTLGQLFEGSKEIAIADAIVNAYKGIALTMSTYPYPVSIAMGALQAAVAFKQVSAIQGAAHGGMTNVPREGTFLLDRGERVLSPNQNRDLEGFMAEGGGGGGGMQVENLHMTFFPNATNPDAMLSMSREQWREVFARKILEAMNDLDKAGVRPVAIERGGR